MGPPSGPSQPGSLHSHFPPPGGPARREVRVGAIKELRVGLAPHANENSNQHLGQGWGVGGWRTNREGEELEVGAGCYLR